MTCYEKNPVQEARKVSVDQIKGTLKNSRDAPEEAAKHVLEEETRKAQGEEPRERPEENSTMEETREYQEKYIKKPRKIN